MSSTVTQSPVSLQLFSYILCNAVNAPDGKMYLNHWLFLHLLILPQDVWNDQGYFRMACLFNWSSPFFGMCCFVFAKPGEYCSTDNFGRAIWCSVEVVPLLVALSNKRNKREKKNSLNFDENWRNNVIADAELEQSCKGDKGHQSDYCKIILHFNTSTHIS